MKFDHPEITLTQPQPGCFIVGNVPSIPFAVADVGRICPHTELYVTPAVPSDALIAILDERGDLPKTRKSKEAAPALTAEHMTAIEDAVLQLGEVRTGTDFEVECHKVADTLAAALESLKGGK